MVKQRAHGDEEDLIRLYLDDVGRHELLTKDDEVCLARLIEVGSEARRQLDEASPGELTSTERRRLRRADREGAEAHRRFVHANLRLVVSIAKRYRASGLPLLDLVQEGNLGLIHAVDKFDWRKGFKFSTYATWWIRQAISRGISNTSRTIRLPVHAADNLVKLHQARAALEARLARPATPAELAEELGMSEAKVTETMRIMPQPISLSELLGSDGDTEIGDLVADRSGPSTIEAAVDSLLPDEVMKMLERLNDRERMIIMLRFGLDRGEPRTLSEIGEHFNLTRERIRQIETHAMAKLRHPANSDELRSLLGA